MICVHCLEGCVNCNQTNILTDWQTFLIFQLARQRSVSQIARMCYRVSVSGMIYKNVQHIYFPLTQKKSTRYNDWEKISVQEDKIPDLTDSLHELDQNVKSFVVHARDG